MKEKFVVTGMTCAACSAHVEKAAGSLPGVNSAVVNLMLGTMMVDYRPAAGDAGADHLRGGERRLRREAGIRREAERP